MQNVSMFVRFLNLVFYSKLIERASQPDQTVHVIIRLSVVKEMSKRTNSVYARMRNILVLLRDISALLVAINFSLQS